MCGCMCFCLSVNSIGLLVCGMICELTVAPLCLASGLSG